MAIAKFPRAEADDWDVMRWEAVALRLARSGGIEVPDWALQVIDGKAVLIVDRFDRNDNLRIGYVSAMTMLEARDGESGSYLDIADVDRTPLAHRGGRPARAVAAYGLLRPHLQHRRPPS